LYWSGISTHYTDLKRAVLVSSYHECTTHGEQDYEQD
jgi:hypothetical protein